MKIHKKLYVISLELKCSQVIKTDYCIVVGFNRLEKVLDTYKIGWQIKILFKAFKDSGFNIKDTHLQKNDRLEKLYMLVMIAFVCCYKIVDYIDTIKSITIKNHDNRFISVFKIGLDHLSRLLLSKNEHNPLNINCLSFFRVLGFYQF